MPSQRQVDYLLSQYIQWNFRHTRPEGLKHASRSLGLLGRHVDGGEVPRLAAVGGRHGPTGGAERPAAGVLEARVGLAEHDRDILPACFIMLAAFHVVLSNHIATANVLWAGC